MTRPRTISWLKDLIVQTVWPYLKALGDEVHALRDTTGSGAGTESAPSAAAAGRFTQQINFTAMSAPGGGYIGPAGTGGVALLDAQLLYRARGGEIIRKYQLTQPASENSEWDIEIRAGDYNRATASGFSFPVRITVDSIDHRVELSPNQTLTAGQCLYAYVDDTVDVAGRVDGTLEIERDATLP